jgi:hypothetical protein
LLLFVLGLDVAVLGSWLAIFLAQEEEGDSLSSAKNLLLQQSLLL